MGSLEPADYLHYDIEDKTEWALVEPAPVTASGLNEVVATLRTKGEAEWWAYQKFGRYWWRNYFVCRKSDLRGEG